LDWGRSYISPLLTKQKSLRVEQVLRILDVIEVEAADFFFELYRFPRGDAVSAKGERYGDHNGYGAMVAELGGGSSEQLDELRFETTRVLHNLRLEPAAPPPELKPAPLPKMEAHHVDASTGRDEMADADAQTAGRAAAPVASRASAAQIDPNDPATWGRVSRNAACPCGSGKKYKHCHGAISGAA